MYFLKNGRRNYKITNIILLFYSLVIHNILIIRLSLLDYRSKIQIFVVGRKLIN